ncbi:Hypothetical predicted protein, partial [Octopus vulgaris]
MFQRWLLSCCREWQRFPCTPVGVQCRKDSCVLQTILIIICTANIEISLVTCFHPISLKGLFYLFI